MSAHAAARSVTTVKVLTLDLQRLSSLTCDLSISCWTVDLYLFLSIFQYVNARYRIKVAPIFYLITTTIQ